MRLPERMDFEHVHVADQTVQRIGNAENIAASGNRSRLRRLDIWSDGAGMRTSSGAAPNVSTRWSRHAHVSARFARE
ncbi:hypothetical protein ACVBGC_16560 [Burkholderia stagnalis]